MEWCFRTGRRAREEPGAEEPRAAAAGRGDGLLALLSGAREQLFGRAALLAEPYLRAAKRAAAELLRRPGERAVVIDDCLQYVALAGYVHDAPLAFGLCKDFWLNNVELRWALKDARHGKYKMTRLMWACEWGYLPRVRELLAWESDVHAQDEGGWTPLHFSSFFGHLAVVRELIGRGAKLEAKNKNGNAALHSASFSGHADVVRFLLDAGADIEAKGNGDATPLHIVSHKGKLEVVRELLARGAAVDARITDGVTPLIKASEGGHAAVLRELLAHGADVNARDNNGITALLMASFCGHAESLRELLMRDDVNVDAQTNDGDTPLNAACSEGRLAAATLLLDRGANRALLDNIGWSALRWAENRVAEDVAAPAAGAEPPTAAQSKEHRDLIKLLKARGAT